MENNKGERERVTKKKFKKRLKKHGFKITDKVDYTFKQQAAPCSCWMCAGEKYRKERHKEKEKIIKKIQEELDSFDEEE